jgi:uncharacterized protein (TIGR02246 family)
MSRIVLVTAVLAALITLAAPSFQKPPDIQPVNARWVQFFNSGDFDGIGSLYTEQATALPPGSPMVRGKAAIAAMWKSLADQVDDPVVKTLDVKRLGPSAAREIGIFSLRTKGPDPQKVTGKYVVVWEKIGTEWKLAVDIWNQDR